MRRDHSKGRQQFASATYQGTHARASMDWLRNFEIVFFGFILLYSSGAIIQVLVLGNDPNIPIEENPARSSLQMVWAAVYVLLLAFIFAHRNSLYISVRQQPLLIALTVYLISSVIWSSAPDVTFQDSIVLSLGTTIGAYIGTRFSTEQIFHLFKYPAMLGVFGSFILVFAWPDLGLMKGVQHVGLWKGAFSHKNVTGLAAVIAIVFFLFCYRNNVYLLVCLVGASVLLMVGARSSTSFMAFAVIMGVYIARRPLSVRGTDVFIVITGGLLLLSIAGSLLLLNLEAFFGLFGKDLTLTGRTMLWEHGFKAFLAKPFLGFGFSAFWHDTSSLGGLAIRALAGWNAPGIHNGWLELLLSVGLVGTVLFFMIFFSLMQKTYFLMRAFPMSVYFYVMMFCILLLVYSISEGIFLLRNSVMHVLIVAFVFSVHRELNEARAAIAQNGAAGR